ncbi:MAG: hypothetical protein ACLPIC_12295 [Rhodoblastus sp.]|uniref:hypothetical protein n=1 Tax=Rhodoblastus sp. TaxID=1962975 RepID=UPI003F9AAC77
MIGRRLFSLGGGAAIASALSACAGVGLWNDPGDGRARRKFAGRTLDRPNYQAVYATWAGESFPIGAFDYRQVDPQFLRQTIEYHGSNLRL